MTDLPANVYRLPQRHFDAIPGAPWVYWVGDCIRDVFEFSRTLYYVARPRQGTATSDNTRFLRFWWEIGEAGICRKAYDRLAAVASRKIWFPYMKGGQFRKWYGNQEFAINWHNDSAQIRAFERAVIRNPDFYFREGVTWTDLGASGFSSRISPGGFIFDVSGSCAFPVLSRDIPGLLAVTNSTITGYLLALLNPTLHYQVGDLARLPVPDLTVEGVRPFVENCVHIAKLDSAQNETTFDFISPSLWTTGLTGLATKQARLAQIERQIDDEVYRLYGISDADRAAIEAELAGGAGALDHEDGEGDEDAKHEEREVEAAPGIMTQEELAVRWISYAVGIVLGRFTVGQSSIDNRQSPIGRAVYRRSDFAIGSLPAPDAAEFDELVGPPERFAYIDDDAGRHVFSRPVEDALRALALPDGIAVLDEGHPRDLPALVEKALRLMLDSEDSSATEAQRTQSDNRDSLRNSATEARRTQSDNRDSLCSLCLRGKSQADEVIATGAGGDLRKFLERDFFTRWHLKWYRKRPVYWPLQSARRGYGFVLFHEKVDKYTLYVLQRDYVDHKLNGLRLQLQDLEAQRAGKSGRELRQLERSVDAIHKLLDEVGDFAQALARITQAGYTPDENWIDDGVILRLAPLWELIPLWKAEPKKHWERLQQGDYDWSHIAMRYWPDRVAAACQTNKSFAIAHGHEEWYQGR